MPTQASSLVYNVKIFQMFFFCFHCFQAITKVMLHPENSALVLTAAMDGIIKVNSLDFMEEIYRSDKTLINCTD